MALNTRAMFDPRWAFAGRAVIAGSMLATVTVYNSVPTGVQNWQPNNPDPTKNKPSVPRTYTKIYVGQARVQPNHDVRARSGQDVAQDVTQQAIRIQLDYAGNTLDNKGNPANWDAITSGDYVTVTNVFTLDGVPVDNDITQFDYSVSLVNATSNAMIKGLLCTVIEQSVGGPRGNL